MPRLRALTTERLRLRQLVADDSPALVALFADERVSHYPHRRARTAAETQAFLDRELARWAAFGFGRMAVLLRDGGGFAGLVGPAPATWPPELMPSLEIGWRLAPAYWHRGLAGEAAGAVVRWIAERPPVPRLICLYEPANLASARVARRLGMRRLGMALHPRFGLQHVDVLPLAASGSAG